MREENKGFLYALVCYIIWGLFPLYWHPLNQSAISAEQMLAQRIVWSALFSTILLILFKKGKDLLQVIKQPKTLALMTASALLIGLNWLTYLWAIMNHHILEASLGYFMNPLFNVFLGYLVFKEKLNVMQWLAIFIAVIGVSYLAILGGKIPWVSIILAGSFAGYGLLRKLSPMNILSGLTLETLILLPLASAYLLWCALHNNFIFVQLTKLQIAILLGSGVITTVPLLLFSAGARRISLSLLGILQYISPSLQMLLGLIIFKENLNTHQLTGYGFVWLAVIIFLWGMRYYPKKSIQS